MTRKIIALLLACMLLGSAALAELYEGPDYDLDLPNGSEYSENQNTLTIIIGAPDPAGNDPLQLTITKSSLSFGCDAQRFLQEYMEAYKEGLISGLYGVNYIENDSLVTFETDPVTNAFIRSVYTYQEKTYCTYIYLLEVTAADNTEETPEIGSLLYSFTSNADPAFVESILSTFRTK